MNSKLEEKTDNSNLLENNFYFEIFQNENDLEPIIKLVEKDLSEPYSIYTYRFFIYDYPRMCIMCKRKDTHEIVGVIVGKAFTHRNKTNRGYLAILTVHQNFRKLGIALHLSHLLMTEMKNEKVDEIVLETEEDNLASLRLYEKLGFARDKHLPNYYLNGSGAFRLKLWLK